MMSVRSTNLLPSFTRPIEIPATGWVSGIPASIIPSVPLQTLALELEPFDSVMSEMIWIVYGKASGFGSTQASDRSARAPWPISRRPGPRIGRHSPTEYDGKLYSSMNPPDCSPYTVPDPCWSPTPPSHTLHTH